MAMTRKDRFLRALSMSPLPFCGVCIWPVLCFIEARYDYPMLVSVWTFLVLPVIDLLLGDDFYNYTIDECVASSAPGQYLKHRWFLFLHPVIHFISIWACFFTITEDPQMSWFRYIALILALGITNTSSSASSHELMHKTRKIERVVGFIGESLYFNGHFNIDHVEGHHHTVGLPEDPNTARYDEGLYQYFVRYIPGVWSVACGVETRRLAKEGKGFYHIDNRILRCLCLPASITVAAVCTLGWHILPFFFCTSFVGICISGMVNYTQHYGLVREIDPKTGLPEPVHMFHSWDCPERFSNWFDVKLQRHVDHHTRCLREWQKLRFFPGAPRMPTGLFGCLVLSTVPPLWKALMHPRIKELEPKAKAFREYRTRVMAKTGRLTSRYGDPAAIVYETMLEQEAAAARRE